ncbi:MAG: histidinol dehydrogenase [Paludibacteraceae bacterium]|nr:histidinol dehydrogenase [Paludibacteraceae bacterium]
MKIIINPERKDWESLLKRPQHDTSSLNEIVSGVLNEIKNEGDDAVRRYELKFDKADLKELAVSEAEIAEAETLVSDELKSALQTAAANIRKFHEAQSHNLPKIETTPGVVCYQKAVAIEKVGLYVPGGTAPLFSTVLMLAIPADIAGCKEIVLCTPPNAEGKVNPTILYAAKISGVKKIFKIGGIQAIGAMAYGTESVPKVYKIFGPGNQFVMAAKQLVSIKDVAIDMPAGPSEVAVIADNSASADAVAADMLSQAEHGKDSQSIVFTDNADYAKEIEKAVEQQIKQSPRQEYILSSIEHSKIFVLNNMDEIIEMSNEYAPEHLIISCRNYKEVAEKITNAGSVFMGYYTPESAGDYASGTNHTLPTSGYAKAYSGVNLDSYLKKITFQEISKEGLEKLGPTIEIMAENELLMAHKYAVTVRNVKN